MDDRHRFDVIAQDVARGAPGDCFLLLDRDLRIRAVSREYEQRVTLRERDQLPGQFMFDAFPDNPGDPHATGASNLAASLEAVMLSGHTHHMRIQRYDVRDPNQPDNFVAKVWDPSTLRC